jgi:leucyl-tRNA synthetase
MSDYKPSTLVDKWLPRWLDAHIFEPEAEPGQKKFLIHFAYPGISGYLHVGHMRGFTYADIISRYKRMTGHLVLYPAGFHASGLPSVGLAKRVARKDPGTIDYLKNNGCPEDIIPKLADPEYVVEYFSNIYTEEYWKHFGFSIDYTRLMTTISPGYKKFITWQFLQLKKKDLLIQGPHYAPFCPGCGPVAVDPSQTDVQQGGSAEMQEFAVLKFQLKDGSILPAATLRPETIFGVTNMWLHPDLEYVKIRVDDLDDWIVSEEAARKLEHQRERVERIGTVHAKELIGQTCHVPIANNDVPILPGEFVDPTISTGVVMSVPAHAPYDWIAVVDLQKKPELLEPFGIPPQVVQDVKPISLIKTSKSDSEDPAGDICKEMDVQSQHDIEKLEEATKTIYKMEFHSGVMTALCGEYAGLRVDEVKDTLFRDFIDMGVADVFYEFSEKVVCRCGEDVIIKLVPDQWFIKYSDFDLTESSKEHARSMNIIPKEYYEELPGVLDWFKDRACIRQGSWLGTEFPFKKDWIIEPISDSTLYPAYYIISKYINNGTVTPEQLTEQFFDYVFLGQGTPENFSEVAPEILDKIKTDFDFFYPVDINLGGKEHKTVHFPVFLMNHVAIMPENKRPLGIFVNWWVTQAKGDKISKSQVSKGGAEPIPDAAEKYTVDGMRLYYAHVGSANLDIEWDQNTVLNYRSRLNRAWELFSEIRAIIVAGNSSASTANPDNAQGSSTSTIDQWLVNAVNNRIQAINNYLELYDLRAASNEIYFGIFQDLRWYLRRGGNNPEILNQIVEVWIKAMSPFTPFIAEELWELFGFSGETENNKLGFVATDVFPEFNPETQYKHAEVFENYLKSVTEDINEIIKVIKKKPEKVIIYTTPTWKQKMHELAFELLADDNLDMGSLMQKAMAVPEIKPQGKAAPAVAQRLVKELSKLRGVKDREKERQELEKELNEYEYLTNAAGFLENQFGCKIRIYSADDDSAPNPGNKLKAAMPGRPAIYIE